jgi:hypothetical protein
MMSAGAARLAELITVSTSIFTLPADDGFSVLILVRSIGFNCVGKPSQVLIPLQFAPTAEIECRLILLSWKLDGQRHKETYMARGSGLACIAHKSG